MEPQVEGGTRLKRVVPGTVLAVVLLLGLAGGAPGGENPPLDSRQPVLVLTVEGPIIPIVASYLDRGIGEAEAAGGIVVIRLDTPGGLVDTTYEINRRILESRVPVVVYVSPDGGRAASAGVYILYASHVAAMAPGTHLGAATPVAIGTGGGEGGRSGGMDPAMHKKIVNDMVAYARNLAEKRGRNAEWVEESVREGVTLTASEALERRVVDLVASSLEDLLRQVEGRRVELGAGVEAVLRPARDRTREVPMTGVERFLSTLSHPELALLLMMIGVAGILYGIQLPGTFIPETVGAICLIMGLYALGNLPINYAGLGLVLLAVLLFVAEVKAPSHGGLTMLGILSMVLGGTLLVPEGYPYLEISRTFLVALAVLSAATFSVITAFVMRTLRRQPVSGREGLPGLVGTARDDLDPEGQVSVAGEIWQARARQAPVRRGEKVKVVRMEGFRLLVEPLVDE